MSLRSSVTTTIVAHISLVCGHQSTAPAITHCFTSFNTTTSLVEVQPSLTCVRPNLLCHPANQGTNYTLVGRSGAGPLGSQPTRVQSSIWRPCDSTFVCLTTTRTTHHIRGTSRSISYIIVKYINCMDYYKHCHYYYHYYYN